MTDTDKSLLVKVAIGVALFFLAKRVLSDLFKGIRTAVARPFGYGLSEVEQERYDNRFATMELFDPYGPGYENAPDHERQWVQQNWSAVLRPLDDAISDAPGFINDDEQAVMRVFRQVDSRFRVMWMGRLFSGSYHRTLGVFGPDEIPSLGEYLNAFLQPGEWIPVLDYIENLPQYTNP